MRWTGRTRGLAVVVAVVGATMFSSVGLASAQTTAAEAQAACRTDVATVVRAAGAATPTAAQQADIATANTACDALAAGASDDAIIVALQRALATAATGGNGADGQPGDTTGTAQLVAQCRDAVAAVAGATTDAVTQANALCDGLEAGDSFAGIVAAVQAGVPTTTAPLSDSVATGAGLNCSDFADQADAQAQLVADPTDPDDLDADDDGTACETVASSAAYTGFPSGGVASGDGSTEGLDLGQIALLVMVGFTALSGAAKVALVRAGKVD